MLHNVVASEEADDCGDDLCRVHLLPAPSTINVRLIRRCETAGDVLRVRAHSLACDERYDSAYSSAEKQRAPFELHVTRSSAEASNPNRVRRVQECCTQRMP